MGAAVVRLGMAFASPEIIQLLSKVKYPYNINQLTQNYALNLLKDTVTIEKWINEIKEERKRSPFASKTTCYKIYPSDANFILIKVTDANAIYNYLVEKGIYSQSSLCTMRIAYA